MWRRDPIFCIPISGCHSNGKTLGELKNSKVGYFWTGLVGHPGRRDIVPHSPLHFATIRSSLTSLDMYADAVLRQRLIRAQMGYFWTFPADGVFFLPPLLSAKLPDRLLIQKRSFQPRAWPFRLCCKILSEFRWWHHRLGQRPDWLLAVIVLFDGQSSHIRLK